VHLARWRGHALAHFGRSDATTVLRDALDQHDAEFTRAEAGLRTDLVLACIALGDRDAARHELTFARRIADAVDSARQRRRLTQAAAALAS
jgi:alpha-D-ribose 1-methylphosphonate 5-triphosphate diphosphatase PhnM